MNIRTSIAYGPDIRTALELGAPIVDEQHDLYVTFSGRWVHSSANCDATPVIPLDLRTLVATDVTLYPCDTCDTKAFSQLCDDLATIRYLAALLRGLDKAEALLGRPFPRRRLAAAHIASAWRTFESWDRFAGTKLSRPAISRWATALLPDWLDRADALRARAAGRVGRKRRRERLIALDADLNVTCDEAPSRAVRWAAMSARPRVWTDSGSTVIVAVPPRVASRRQLRKADHFVDLGPQQHTDTPDTWLALASMMEAGHRPPVALQFARAVTA